MAKKAKVVNSGALLERLNGTSSNKMSAMLAESIFFNDKDTIRTRVPIINLMMSGRLDGGITPGLTCIAGPSKHFKSNLSLVMVSAYLRKYPDAVCLFFDNEFGSTPDYFTSQGVDISRVIHCPFIDVEELKFDIVKKLEAITRGDKVIIYIDSIGNVASKKELQDAKDEKSAQDMTRAKQIKSLFRMVTPYLTVLDIPCIAVNHTYETQEMFSKTVMSGGCVVSGTKIQMGDGSLKNVEDIKEGEFVKSMVGTSMVTHTWNPDTLEVGEPECYEVEFEDGYKVTCSDIHKFLIMDGDTPKWVMAKDLVVGMDNVEI